jgi:hypothetical protein
MPNSKTAQRSGAALRWLAISILFSLPLAGQAQLPELAAATGSGAVTTARFFGGVTADGGLSYGSDFAFDQAIDVLTELRVEPEHVNTVGNIYLIIFWENTYFIGLESGEFVVWDFSLETLQPIRAEKTLADVESIPVVENVAFGPAGVSETTLQIYLAYDSVAAENELYYTAQPLTFSIAAELSQAQSLTLYSENISGPIIQNQCRACHFQGGSAGSTPLLYLSSTQSDFLNTNYNTLVSYITNGGAATLLAKPSGGQAHSGGVLLAPGSSNYQNFSDFIDAVVAENP